jgi:hypothetical protein
VFFSPVRLPVPSPRLYLLRPVLNNSEGYSLGPAASSRSARSRDEENIVHAPGKLERFKRPSLCMSVFRQIFCLEIFILCGSSAGDGDRTRDDQGRKTFVFHHVSQPERPTCQLGNMDDRLNLKNNRVSMASTVEHQIRWSFYFPNLRAA